MEYGTATGKYPPVSLIVPTYREAENIAALAGRVDAVRRAHDLDLEMLLMDDDSRDGTEAAVADLDCSWLRLVIRRENRGLSPAVIDGFREARHDVFVVMDADLSHPPEKIPELLGALEDGADFVIGSRYTAGGSTDDDWGVLLQVNSTAATLLARPLTRAEDPMSGFFALRRETLEAGAPLNPVGYKIGLELLVKCRCRDVREVPIHFSKRERGESKLSFSEQLRYLIHLGRLYRFRIFGGG
jgi:dolichol-phosphate mannosyltransferase